MELTRSYITLTLIKVITGFIVQEPVQNASLHEMYTALKLEIASLSVKAASLQKDYNTAKLENDNLKKELANLTQTSTLVETELANTKIENTELREQLQNISTEFSAMQSTLTYLTSDHQLLNQQFVVLSNLYSELTEKFENLTKDNTSNPETSLSNSKARVGFSVSWPEREPYGQTHEGPLKFSNTFYDDDNMYNGTLGKFVCEIPGLYFFSSMLIRQVGQHTASSCYIMVNDVTLTYLEGYSFNASYGSPSATGTTLYHMQAGDTASIGNCSNVNQIAGYSNFNGFLIDAD
ncbi:uncharacterized protein LOC123528748 [Mercenaria mercenaria]|uniref:uncharacterized protein LOC123528748 n=1 Tax=Mercenaria mercenaria TaxID=6596 RepID=UPI001E1D5227|nr:uncharacterized protein LOC123528748 [Mercenaria mercenaria]